MPLVNVDSVSLSYPCPHSNTEFLNVLKDTSFEIGDGEFVTLLGPTGCGKTSLLRIVAGLVKPSSGQVLVGGQRVSDPSPIAAYVFQQIALIPWRTVQRNVELALEMRHHRRMSVADHSRAREITLIRFLAECSSVLALHVRW